MIINEDELYAKVKNSLKDERYSGRVDLVVEISLDLCELLWNELTELQKEIVLRTKQYYRFRKRRFSFTSFSIGKFHFGKCNIFRDELRLREYEHSFVKSYSNIEQEKIYNKLFGINRLVINLVARTPGAFTLTADAGESIIEDALDAGLESPDILKVFQKHVPEIT